MLTTQQLNTLACRVIWAMRSNAANHWFPHPQIRIQRPFFQPCNDFFEIYWGMVHLGNLIRPGCGRDWELRLINLKEESLLFQFFTQAICQIIQ